MHVRGYFYSWVGTVINFKDPKLIQPLEVEANVIIWTIIVADHTSVHINIMILWILNT